MKMTIQEKNETIRALFSNKFVLLIASSEMRKVLRSPKIDDLDVFSFYSHGILMFFFWRVVNWTKNVKKISFYSKLHLFQSPLHFFIHIFELSKSYFTFTPISQAMYLAFWIPGAKRIKHFFADWRKKSFFFYYSHGPEVG